MPNDTPDPTSTVRDLLDAHNAAPYPPELSGGDEVAGVALVMLDADIAGLAHDHGAPASLATALREPNQVGCGEHPGVGGAPSLDIEQSDAARI